MRIPYLIGLGAGLVSAVLFASAVTNTMLALALLYLAPLPVFLAGLGWGWAAAAMAAVAGTGLIVMAMGAVPAAAYGIGLGAPTVVLCYLALLSREIPSGPAGASTLEWYPPGRLVAWATAMAGGLTVVSMVAIGMDTATLQAMIVGKLDEVIAALGQKSAANVDKEYLARLATYLARVAPAASAIVWLLIMLLNMLLAGRIVEASGRALRPWPDIQGMTYPGLFSLAAAVAFVLAFAGGAIGSAATAFAGAFVLAYLLLGLAIVHVLTRSSPFRGFLLASVYLAILFLGWAALIIAALGLCEPLLRLRERVAPASPGPGAGPD